MDKFIHHDTLSARYADEARRAGYFDVIEETDGFYVYDCFIGMYRGGRSDSLADATEQAQKLVDEYDAEVTVP